jgi:N6-L-threonylcarbamoyladenine synthase
VIVLGIETSCDETAVAVVEDDLVRSNLITAQIEVHRPYGGVVPELASRAHLRAVNRAVAQATDKALVALRDVDAIAVTMGPGLIGALLVGFSAAKALAYALDVPLIGVNHLEGHIEAAFLERPDLTPPLLALVVSGGHTMIVEMADHGRFAVVGSTIDDAAGEAFDKIARFMGLPFPGGPEIDRLARRGNPSAVRFPRPMLDDGTFDFSMSGLKTAVIRWLREQDAAGRDIDPADVAASFQEAIVDVQVTKTVRAALERGLGAIVVAGGVAANSRLRERMTAAGAEHGIDVVVPSVALCTDNGAMIAAAGMRRLLAGETTPLDAGPNPSLGLGA